MILNKWTMAIEASLCTEVVHRRRGSHTLLKVVGMSSSPHSSKQLAFNPESALRTKIAVERFYLSLITTYLEKVLRSADCN